MTVSELASKKVLFEYITEIGYKNVVHCDTDAIYSIDAAPEDGGEKNEKR